MPRAGGSGLSPHSFALGVFFCCIAIHTLNPALDTASTWALWTGGITSEHSSGHGMPHWAHSPGRHTCVWPSGRLSNWNQLQCGRVHAVLCWRAPPGAPLPSLWRWQAALGPAHPLSCTAGKQHRALSCGVALRPEEVKTWRDERVPSLPPSEGSSWCAVTCQGTSRSDQSYALVP